MIVRFRKKALRDIEGIHAWLALRDSPAVARSIEAALFAAADRLGEHPMLGVATDFANMRRWPVPGLRYAIFYRPSVQQFVDIARVVDGQQLRDLNRPPRG